MSGSMSGMWKRGTVWIMRHRQTKGPDTDRPDLNNRATSRLYSLLGFQPNDFDVPDGRIEKAAGILLPQLANYRPHASGFDAAMSMLVYSHKRIASRGRLRRFAAHELVEDGVGSEPILERDNA